MVELRRTVRFCLNDSGGDAPGGADPPRHNSHAAWPPMRGLGRYYELEVACRGEADPATGYFINIKHIDTAVRQYALPRVRAAAEGGGSQVPLGALLRDLLHAVQPPLGDTVTRVALRLTPFLVYALEADDMKHAILRHRYEFSAAHRLHAAGLSDEENREVFGKCNNPEGHGHNYGLEVAVRVPITDAGHTLAVEHLDRCVDENAIERLDHRHLNRDVPEFKNTNPSVENISRVVWEMLVDAVGGLMEGAALEEVSVWETGKTVCTYRG